MTPSARLSLFQRLMLAFATVLLAAFAVSALLATLAGNHVLRALVDETVLAQTSEVLLHVDSYVAARVEEVRFFADLDIMEDVLIQDRDLRIRNFLLAAIRERPAQYANLTVVDRNDTVVASTDPARVGQVLPLRDLAPREVPGGTVYFGPPSGGESAGATLLLGRRITSRLHTEPIGLLVGEVRWEPVEQILSDAQAVPPRDVRKYALLINERGEVVAGRRDLLGPRDFAVEALRRAPEQAEVLEDLGASGRFLLAREVGGGEQAPHVKGFQVVALWDRKEAYELRGWLLAANVGSAALGLVLSAGAAWFIARSLTRRVRMLVAGTERLAAGDLGHRVPEVPNGEFGLLAQSFNRMAQSLARALADVEASAARWESLVTHAPDAIMTLDQEGTILFLNRTLTGQPVEELIGSNVISLLPSSQREVMRAGLERVFREGEVVKLDVAYTRPDGIGVWYACRFGPIRVEGRVTTATGIVTDVTERIRLERQVLEVSEEERRRIGQDLHDGMGQVLTGVSLLVRSLWQRLEGRALEEAAEARRIEDLIQQAIRQSRALARGLFPVSIGAEGLQGAVEELAASAEEMAGVSCRVVGTAPLEPEDPARGMHLFRIVQEAVNNTLRHARARNVVISFESEGGRRRVAVTDDGVGFEGPPPQHGLGINLMRYRASVIGASLEIHGRPGLGTTVTCWY